jgi:predicted component of type VI protein secretion system
MKKIVVLILLLGAGLFLCSCAKKPVPVPTGYKPPEPVSPPPPQPVVVMPTTWSFGKDAIRLYLKSDPRLNIYDGVPHTLLLCIYQMTDPNAFNQLREEKDGLPKLLECTRFDPSVASSRRQIMQPAKEVPLSLDRAEGAKYVGIVGGYYQLEKENSVRLFQVPVVEEFLDDKKQTKTMKPDVLNIRLYLGPQLIQEIKGK